jgi:hypothetical protein
VHGTPANHLLSRGGVARNRVTNWACTSTTKSANSTNSRTSQPGRRKLAPRQSALPPRRLTLASLAILLSTLWSRAGPLLAP